STTNSPNKRREKPPRRSEEGGGVSRVVNRTQISVADHFERKVRITAAKAMAVDTPKQIQSIHASLCRRLTSRTGQKAFHASETWGASCHRSSSVRIFNSAPPART